MDSTNINSVSRMADSNSSGAVSAGNSGAIIGSAGGLSDAGNDMGVGNAEEVLGCSCRQGFSHIKKALAVVLYRASVEALSLPQLALKIAM